MDLSGAPVKGGHLLVAPSEERAHYPLVDQLTVLYVTAA